MTTGAAVRWIAGLCACSVLFLAATAGSSERITGTAIEPAVPKVCKSGAVLVTFEAAAAQCVKTKQTCDRKQNAAYLRAGLKCVAKTERKRGKRRKVYRLRKLTGSERRLDAPVRAAPGGTIPLDVALAAVERAFGVDMPGFKAQKGLVGDFEDDGTGPLQWARAHRSRLTSAQRKVLDGIVPAPAATVRKSQAEAFTVPEVQAALDTVLPWTAAYMGRDLPSKPALVEGEDDDPDVAASADPRFDGSGNYTGCIVYITDKGLAYKQFADGLRSLKALLIHELVHCHQGLIAGKAFNTKFAAGTWMFEGFARFAAVEIIAANDPGSNREQLNALSNSKTFLKNPQVPVIERSYDAGPFWRMLADAGMSPLQAHERGLLTLASGKTAQEVYDAVVNGGATDTLLRDAGPAFFRRLDWGPIWDIRGEGIHGTATPGALEFEVSNSGDVIDVEAQPYAFGAQRLSLTADFIYVKSTEGTRGRLHVRDGDGEGLAIDDKVYTTLDDPSCPNGGQIPQIAGRIAPGEAALGMSGGSTKAVTQVKGQSLEDLCAPKVETCTPPSFKPKTSGACFRMTDDGGFLASGSGTSVECREVKQDRFGQKGKWIVIRGTVKFRNGATSKGTQIAAIFIPATFKKTTDSFASAQFTGESTEPEKGQPYGVGNTILGSTGGTLTWDLKRSGRFEFSGRDRVIHFGTMRGHFYCSSFASSVG